ncbi:MAG: T9SS type A sorting domain-containing protein [Bacteroidales bacterium]|nr:T9SS type A sorting domain-containing protein [Bacteroidales bacterium]
MSKKTHAQKYKPLKIDSINLTGNNNQQSVFLKVRVGNTGYFFSQIQDTVINDRANVNVYFKLFCNNFPAYTWYDTTWQLNPTYPTISELRVIVFMDTNTINELHSIPLCQYDTITPIDTAYYPSSISAVNDYFPRPVVNLYPNPAREFITFDFPFADKCCGADVIIYKITGEIIMKGNIKSCKSKLNTSFLDPGLYFYQIRSSDKSASGKFLKVKES